jgi:hypothetical protein
MFMFISCIIMNIVMFNCGLNKHTCTWIVSLTTILKCLLNVAYLLTRFTSGTVPLPPHSLLRHESRVAATRQGSQRC